MGEETNEGTLYLSTPLSTSRDIVRVISPVQRFLGTGRISVQASPDLPINVVNVQTTRNYTIPTWCYIGNIVGTLPGA